MRFEEIPQDLRGVHVLVDIAVGRIGPYRTGPGVAAAYYFVVGNVVGIAAMIVSQFYAAVVAFGFVRQIFDGGVLVAAIGAHPGPDCAIGRDNWCAIRGDTTVPVHARVACAKHKGDWQIGVPGAVFKFVGDRLESTDDACGSDLVGYVIGCPLGKPGPFRKATKIDTVGVDLKMRFHKGDHISGKLHVVFR